jgi:hypothetical protein
VVYAGSTWHIKIQNTERNSFRGCSSTVRAGGS